jgi:hypothetical protein
MQPGGGAARTQAEVAEAAGRRHGQLQRNMRPLAFFCIFGRVRWPESLDKVTVTDRPEGQNFVLQEYKSRDSEIACTDPEGDVGHMKALSSCAYICNSMHCHHAPTLYDVSHLKALSAGAYFCNNMNCHCLLT